MQVTLRYKSGQDQFQNSSINCSCQSENDNKRTTATTNNTNVTTIHVVPAETRFQTEAASTVKRSQKQMVV